MGTDKLSLPEALYLLIHSRSYREIFLNGATDQLGLDDGDIACLATVDCGELQRTARKVVHNLLHGNEGGGQGLVGSYPGTFGLFGQLGLATDELAMEFMETQWFDAYREVPAPERGLCVEEAFFGYVAALRLPSPVTEVAAHELHIALLSLLVVNPEPVFEIGSAALRRNPACHYAVRSVPAQILAEPEDQPPRLYLYAATSQRFIHGPVFPLAAALLQIGDRTELGARVESLCDEHDCSGEEVIAVADQLASKGLLV